MSVFSNTVRFVAESGTPVCVVLPCPPRGSLDRLVVQQTGGDEEGFAFAVYDRRGACESGADLYTSNGEVVACTDNGSGVVRVETASPHGLVVGDVVEVKGTDEDACNTTHTVAAVVGATVFDTDVSHVEDGLGGYWQTAPEVFPTDAPPVHAVYPLTVVSGTGAYADFDVDQGYANRDNQHPLARRLEQALYLDLTAAGSGDKSFQVGYTAEPSAAF